MESVQELIPFAKEILRQKPSRGMVKVYLIGSVLALAGLMVGVMDIACQPFSTDEPVDKELEQEEVVEKRTAGPLKLGQKSEAASALDEENDLKIKKQTTIGRRNSATRLHAS